MLLQLDRHSGVPVYRQIVEQVRRQVASGLLAPGAQLPSTRALSSAHGLNPMTVSKAYSLLERDGVVERRPGLALVVRAQPRGKQSAARQHELYEVLERAAQAALLLGAEPKEALEGFREALEERALEMERRLARASPKESKR
jgi:GntR family transcriptional regulator